MSVTDWLPRDETKRVAEEMSVFSSEDLSVGFALRELVALQEKIVLRIFGYIDKDRPLYDVQPELSLPVPSQDWMALVEGSSHLRPARDVFTIVIDGLLDAISDGSFQDLDQLFGRIDVAKVSTDYLVALLSITFENREQLPEWRRLYERAVPELQKRGVDVELELAGLDDVAGTS